MDRGELSLHYAERLGYLSNDTIIKLLESGETVDKALTKAQLCYVKFIVFKHHLLQYAEKAGFVTNAQSKILLRQKIKEIKRNPKSINLQTLDVNIIPFPFFKKVLDALNAQKIFTYQDFKELTANLLSLPRSVTESLAKMIGKKKQMQAASEAREYRAVCEKCGNITHVRFDANCKFILLSCGKCGVQMIDTASKPQSQTKIAAAEKDDLATEKNEEFAHYILLEKLGEGGMGKVYLAIDKKNQEKVALKVLHEPDNERSVLYFVREIDILYQLKHPNIVELKSWGKHDGHPYLAMEYLEGGTLLKYPKPGALSIRHACKIISFVLDALAYTYEKKIVHRDIKPDNIYIAKSGVVKLLDLGIAKIMEESGGYSKTGQILGSGYYMPPEQLKDSKNVDHHSDIYSVGATLFHALCGSPPYGEFKGNMRKMFWAKINDSYIRLGGRSPNLPPRIVQVVEKAMAPDPNDRYAHPLEMKENLALFLTK